MKKRRIGSPVVPEPPPQTWSNALVVGNQVFVAGMTARSGSEVVGGDSMYGQSRAIFEKIRHLMEAAGGKMDDIVKVTVFVTDVRYREPYGEVRSEFFGPNPPASTLVQISNLAIPGALIEIEAIAAIDS